MTTLGEGVPSSSWFFCCCAADATVAPVGGDSAVASLCCVVVCVCVFVFGVLGATFPWLMWCLWLCYSYLVAGREDYPLA